MSRGLDRWLGVDVGGTNIKWAILDGDSLAESGATPTPQDGERAVVARVAALIGERAGGTQGVGITVPGHVDDTTGRTGIVPNLPGRWRDFPLRDALARDTGRRVALLNDARAYALAELHLGAAAALADVLFVVVGTGVGGAVVLQRELLGGAAGRVGEVGHVSVRPGGPPAGAATSAASTPSPVAPAWSRPHEPPASTGSHRRTSSPRPPAVTWRPRRSSRGRAPRSRTASPTRAPCSGSPTSSSAAGSRGSTPAWWTPSGGTSRGWPR